MSVGARKNTPLLYVSTSSRESPNHLPPRGEWPPQSPGPALALTTPSQLLLKVQRASCANFSALLATDQATDSAGMSFSEQQWTPTSVQVTVLQARGLRIKGKSGTNDAYALMQVGKDKYQTSVVEKSVAPVWKEEATFDLPPPLQGAGRGGPERGTLRVHVLHRALVGPDKLLGQAVISLPQLSEDKSRNKTEWFKLLDKTGKPDKDRGEVLVDVQFMRNNMTASMFDLSAVGKSRSRLGKLKDKVRGKKKESDSVSSVVPSFSQVLTDSEEEEANGDGMGASKDGNSKKHKKKSLFSPKTNLQRNLSQSMSVLPPKNSFLSGSQSSGLNVEPSEGKKKFKFMIHKRSSSSESKDLSSGHHKQVPVEQSTLCINGSHVYCEEPQPRTSRISSNFSVASSGHGSMEEVPESSPPSVDSLRAGRQCSPWTEEEEEEEEEKNAVDGTKREQEERTSVEEHWTKEEEALKSQEVLERLAQGKLRREEEERMELEEKVKREEEERILKEEKRKTEERLKQEEEEQKKLSKERERQEEVKRKLEEKRQREEIIRRNEEKIRREEEERAEEKRKKRRENKLAEEKRALEEEEERIAKEKIRQEEEQMRVAKEKAEEERRRKEAEEELVREQEMEQLKQREEEERMIKEKEECERIEEEMKLQEERKRIELERLRKEEEERRRVEEERIRKEEEMRKVKEKERKQREELERLKKEEEERRRVEEEERIRKEEEIKQKEEMLRRQEEVERLAREKLIQEEEERRKIQEKMVEEDRIRKEEAMTHERARKEREEFERLEEEKIKLVRRRKEEEERIDKEEQEIIRKKEIKRRQEDQETASEEKCTTGRISMATKSPEEKRIEGEDKVRGEKIAENEKGKEGRKQGKDILREAEEQMEKEKGSNMERDAGIKCIPSTNPFDENPFESPEDESDCPSVPLSHTAEEEPVQQRSQLSVSLAGNRATSTNEKDPVTNHREKRPAPLPPGKNPAEGPRLKEQDLSAERLPQVNQKAKDVKTVSVLPQRSVRTLQNTSTPDPKKTQRPGQNGTTKVTTTKHGKRPAPSRPSAAQEPSSEPKTASGKSHGGGSEKKQVQNPHSFNPFEDDDDEDETSVPEDTGPVQWPAAMYADKDASKIKSSKIAHAPLPPPNDNTVRTLISQTNDKGHVVGTSVTNVPKNDPQVCVREEGPPPSLRRLQPVKPLNAPEQQSALVMKGEKDHKSADILSGLQDKTKVNNNGITGPYSQLTREELISLVLKQENQLSERDKKISELEQYIDNLLVRVIEEQPSILMSLNSLKKAA
ncbi:unnamed protein product [Menidia menidia]|uniref:(Atlantic silverside) hypothetical protein n=1 Tax=Menidia menidia TaxID=238744 RepID=A0A8S4AGP9_9TELE|nr:unnamed protein product [Menidia menidia]